MKFGTVSVPCGAEIAKTRKKLQELDDTVKSEEIRTGLGLYEVIRNCADLQE